MRQLSRDPFARITYYQRSVFTSFDYPLSIQPDCAFCGGHGRSTKRGYFLYQYGTYTDGIYNTVYWEPKLFCCKSCHDSYHGL
jgi:hypothetical protein